MNKIKIIPFVGAAAAAFLVYRTSRYAGNKLKKCIVVDRSPEELYRFWRNFENFPRFLDELKCVEVLDERRSRWTVAGPGGLPITWDAEITVDRPNEMIGWRSLPGSKVDTKGYVRFECATGARGTLVRVAMQVVPPAGKAGAAVATIFGKRPGAEVEEALRRFKQLMEAGETAFMKSSESVELASEESFPASDPPAWTGTGL